MTEEEFWGHLERRVSEEFAGLGDAALRFLWCDGFIPECYDLDRHPPIAGRAWIGDSKAQEQWTFRLLLPEPLTDASSINWSTLIPSDDRTGWLAPNRGTKHLEVDPAAAVPEV